MNKTFYQGVRDNGECVAVKKLNLRPGIEEEFEKEFKELMRIQHRNITRLVGHCHHIEQVPVEHNGEYVSARVEERALCFEYLEGGSLDEYLEGGSLVEHLSSMIMLYFPHF